MFVEDELSGKITHLQYAKGFGFIQDEKGVDYFFHAHEARGFERMTENDKVIFFRLETDRGLRAVRVRVDDVD